MKDFGQRVDRVLSVLTAVVVVVMMVHIVAHGVFRYFFNAPIYGTNEIVSYWYLPVVALLGIPAAQLQNEHITVTLFKERLGELGQRIIHRFACALGVLVSIGFAWFGFGEALAETAIGATAGVTDIIAWPVRFLVPAVFVLIAILYLIDMVAAKPSTIETDVIEELASIDGLDADAPTAATTTGDSPTNPAKK